MSMTPDLVSSTIVARSREPEGLRTMLIVSSIGHLIGLTALVILPWMLGLGRTSPESVMVISLPGSTGVDSGGMTAASRRPVQEVAKPSELPKPDPPRPPAPKPPEMVENVAKTPPKPTVKQAPPTTRPSRPTAGPQPQTGQPRAGEGTSNQGGLSTSSGGMNGSSTNVNFCDPAYLAQMVSIIYRNWNRQQPVTGSPVVRFVIQRDGTLTDVALAQSSNYFALDLAARRAVELTKAIPPLPSCYPHPDYTMNLTFEYIR